MMYAVGAEPSGWAWLAMVVSVLLIAGLSVGAYLILVRGGGRRTQHTAAQRRLADQFARGQITKQEYLHLTAALDAARAGRRHGTQTPTPPGPDHRDEAGAEGSRHGRDARRPRG